MFLRRPLYESVSATTVGPRTLVAVIYLDGVLMCCCRPSGNLRVKDGFHLCCAPLCFSRRGDFDAQPPFSSSAVGHGHVLHVTGPRRRLGSPLPSLAVLVLPLAGSTRTVSSRIVRRSSSTSSPSRALTSDRCWQVCCSACCFASQPLFFWGLTDCRLTDWTF